MNKLLNQATQEMIQEINNFEIKTIEEAILLKKYIKNNLEWLSNSTGFIASLSEKPRQRTLDKN